MRRFIYKKVVTGMPVIPEFRLLPVQPRPRLLRSWRNQGFYVLGQPPDAETITSDKWAPTYPVMRPHRFARNFASFFPDTLFEIAAPPTAPALDSWFMPAVQPRQPASRLSPALISSGNASGFVPPSGTVGDAFYKIKLFSRSRKTDL